MSGYSFCGVDDHAVYDVVVYVDYDNDIDKNGNDYGVADDDDDDDDDDDYDAECWIIAMVMNILMAT